MRAQGKPRSAASAWVVIALVAALAVNACGDGDGDGSDGEPRGGARTSGHAMQARIPAQIDQRPQGFAPASVLQPLQNAWRASDGGRFTEVAAGSLATDPSTGAFVILRHDFRGVGQEMTLVEVKDAGAVRITRAPVGRRVAGSAQRSGELDFAGARGVRGTLHLSDDRVRLDRR